jgi:hypothetical protein
VHEIFDQEHFEKKLRNLAAGYKKRFGDLLEYDVEEEIARFREYREKLPEFVVDAVNYMQAAQASGVDILIEGANALMLDIDYGAWDLNWGRGGRVHGRGVLTGPCRHIPVRHQQQHRAWWCHYRVGCQPPEDQVSHHACDIQIVQLCSLLTVFAREIIGSVSLSPVWRAC